MSCKQDSEDKAEDVLTIRDFAFLPCDSAARVSQSFSLLSEISKGERIIWESSHPDLISIDQYSPPSSPDFFQEAKAIVKPGLSPEDVVLTARFTTGSKEKTRSFTLTVAPREESTSSPVITDDSASSQADKYKIEQKEKVTESGLKYYTAGYWLDEVWVDLYVPGIDEQASNVKPTSIDVVGPNIYIGGTVSQGFNPIVAGYWKNGVWTELPSTNAPLVQKEITKIMEWEGDVYIVGIIGRIFDKPYRDTRLSGYWKNRTWGTFGLSTTAQHSVVNSIQFTGCDFYANGYLVGYVPSGVPGYYSSEIENGYWKNKVWIPRAGL